jgi:hypothetical protein
LNRLKYVGVVLIFSNLLTCKKELALPDESPLLERKDHWKTYTIDSASHFCKNNDWVSFNTDSLRFTAVFDESARYTSQQPANQSDINKLYGFSDCRTLHQENSARFGWNWQNNALRIYAYVYRNGKRVSKEMTQVDLGRENAFKIQKQSGKYVFTVNGQYTTVIDAGCSAPAEGYRLYPYFGGDEKAPHRITIRIKDLDLQE